MTLESDVVRSVNANEKDNNQMIIKRKSPFSGKENTQEIAVTQEQLDAWQAGTIIQDAMPTLTADEREFIKTGITATEWEETFGGE